MFRTKIKKEALQGFFLSEIKRLKTELNINNSQLAKAAKMQKTQLNEYLLGNQDTKSQNVERMLVFLGYFNCK